MVGNRLLAFCHHWKLYALCCCCFIFTAKEKSTELLVEPNRGPCDIREGSIIFLHTRDLIDSDSIKYETSSHICTK